jgi:hypothetical protein
MLTIYAVVGGGLVERLDTVSLRMGTTLGWEGGGGGGGGGSSPSGSGGGGGGVGGWVGRFTTAARMSSSPLRKNG